MEYEKMNSGILQRLKIPIHQIPQGNVFFGPSEAGAYVKVSDLENKLLQMYLMSEMYIDQERAKGRKSENGQAATPDPLL